MRTFLFIFIFALSLKAESSYQAKCVDSFYLTSTGTNHRINIYYSGNSVLNSLVYTSALLNELISTQDKFKYDPLTKRCNQILKNNTLGMTNEQYNFLMALSGVLIGSLILFFILGI